MVKINSMGVYSTIKKLYPNFKPIFNKYELILNNDYSFSSHAKTYQPYFNEIDSKIVITYYGIGFKPIGEITITEKQCTIDIPHYNILEIIMVKKNNDEQR